MEEGLHPVLGWAVLSPGRGMFDLEKVEAPNFSQNLKPKPVYNVWENFGSRFNCRKGQSCYVPDFDMDNNGIVGKSDLIPFMKWIYFNYELGDWTVAKFTNTRLEPGGCHVVQYEDTAVDPSKHLFQGCFNPEKRKMWTDGKYMWVGPVGLQSKDLCGN